MYKQRLMLPILHLAAVVVLLMVVAPDCASTQYEMTTMAANTSHNDTDCLCDCDELDAALNISTNVPTTHEEAKKAAEQLVRDLRLDRHNLSSSTRKKTSAPDHRTSAQGMGVVAILVIIFVVGSVVVLDFTVLVTDVKIAFTRIFGNPQAGPPNRYRVPRRIRRGLRRGTTSRHFYSSSFPGTSAAATPAVLREKAELTGEGIGTKNLAPGLSTEDKFGGSGGGEANLRNRREMLLMYETPCQ